MDDTGTRSNDTEAPQAMEAWKERQAMDSLQKTIKLLSLQHGTPFLDLCKQMEQVAMSMGKTGLQMAELKHSIARFLKSLEKDKEREKDRQKKRDLAERRKFRGKRGKKNRMERIG